ncbi:DUF2970 domain-containing protein [Noviherbaspirillum denitrificans]|uniref:DUF2970 domain-containing protein n=1 Tax=Noviherbaspirillum denitrificans TaxID=1968433 RepID=A0A254T966_9BURK|nr:DUF2970 domain-containing protein [Noviherbaspirillum denitrificans]OWW19189.1 hypothetical protein AYR66_06425 [Noviherbaspirillum denitrificans]
MPTNETKKTRSFLSTMIAVAWSFIGLRRKRDFDEDVGGLNPVYVVAGGLIGTAIFIGILLTIVNMVTA